MKDDIRSLQSYVYEAQSASREWRSESWQDEMMYDGGKGQWTEQEWTDMESAGITPLTINQTFASLQVILGSQSINKFAVHAKARTHKDAEISQVMSEGIRFVMDQNKGEFLISEAFKGQCVPGIHWLGVTLNPDPRKEKIKLSSRPWREIWWDPFSSPWVSPQTCQYIFHQRYVDLDIIESLFPKKRRELTDYYEDIAGKGNSGEYEFNYWEDEDTLIEEERRFLATASTWIDAKRRRVRPVEIWYPKFTPCVFAIMPDGRVLELNGQRDTYDIMFSAQEVVRATVPKMFWCIFIGDLELGRGETPFGHHDYPYVPFVGYMDRYQTPYGVPRQIRDSNKEVNKRRTMAMALLKTRRVMMEEGAISDQSQEGYQHVFEEANKLDGFIIVRDGKLKAIEINENADLAAPQVELLRQSIDEVREISGSSAESMGLQTNATSGEAIKARQAKGSAMSAPLFDNLRRSLQTMGELVQSSIQTFWTGPKVLRITDRVSGADRFVEINQRSMRDDGVIELRNNLNQGRYDIVISEIPQKDTVREAYLDIVMEWVKKSPPEVIPTIMVLAFELSDLPNKDTMLAKIKPLLGQDPRDEDMSPAQVKQKVIAELEAQKEAQAVAAQKQDRMDAEGIEKARLENEKIRAEVKAIQDKMMTARAKVVGDLKLKKEAMDKGVTAPGKNPPAPAQKKPQLKQPAKKPDKKG